MIVLLGAAFIAADAMVYLVPPWRHFEDVELVRIALFYGQHALLWIWVCLGRTRFSLRLSAGIVGTATILFIFSAPEWYRATVVAAAAARLTGQALGILVILGTLRLLGWSIVDVSCRSVLLDKPPRFQFSMRSMMELVTAAAIISGIASIVCRPDEAEFGTFYVTHVWRWFFGSGVSYAVLAALGVWLVFGGVPSFVRSAGWGLGITGIWLISGATKTHVEFFDVSINVRCEHGIGLQAVLIVGALALFRLHGYRLAQPVRNRLAS